MFKSEAEFIRRIAAASLSDTHNAYDVYDAIDEEAAHTSIQLIQGRMEALIAFLDALQFPDVAPAASPAVHSVLLEKEI